MSLITKSIKTGVGAVAGASLVLAVAAGPAAAGPVVSGGGCGAWDKFGMAWARACVSYSNGHVQGHGEVRDGNPGGTVMIEINVSGNGDSDGNYGEREGTETDIYASYGQFTTTLFLTGSGRGAVYSPQLSLR